MEGFGIPEAVGSGAQIKVTSIFESQWNVSGCTGYLNTTCLQLLRQTERSKSSPLMNTLTEEITDKGKTFVSRN